MVFISMFLYLHLKYIFSCLCATLISSIMLIVCACEKESVGEVTERKIRLKKKTKK